VREWRYLIPKLPSADFLHRLADIADRETLPRFRTDLAVDSKTGEGYFDPVTEADREAEIGFEQRSKPNIPTMPFWAKNSV
jgi:fructose-1,6-bisphosphatase/inositol monophosphatase family enzyme